MGRSDLEYLNVKQLKDLLRSNRVDFKGCLERSELLDRASRLWDAHKRSREGKYNYIKLFEIGTSIEIHLNFKNKELKFFCKHTELRNNHFIVVIIIITITTAII